jgi:enoyl-CoA hydratase
LGLANRVVAPGESLEAAVALARELSGFPQRCMLADRASAINQWDLPMDEAVKAEGRHGTPALYAEGIDGAARFVSGAGRHGSFNIR